MPTYQYACKNCGQHLEVVQSFTDDSLTTCPECQGDLRKVWGSVGVVFKGSGFYRNDSRGGSTSTLPGGSSGNGASGGGSSSDGSSGGTSGGESSTSSTDSSSSKPASTAPVGSAS